MGIFFAGDVWVKSGWELTMVGIYVPMRSLYALWSCFMPSLLNYVILA